MAGQGWGIGACMESSMKFSDAKPTSDPASLSSAGASEKPRLYARQRSPPAGSPAVGGEAGLWGHGIWVPEPRSAERGRGTTTYPRPCPGRRRASRGRGEPLLGLPEVQIGGLQTRGKEQREGAGGRTAAEGWAGRGTGPPTRLLSLLRRAGRRIGRSRGVSSWFPDPSGKGGGTPGVGGDGLRGEKARTIPFEE